MTAPRARVAIVINTYEDRAESGGFVHLFEAAKRWSAFDVTVFGPECARERVARELPGAAFEGIPSFERLRSRAVVYVLRMLASLAVASPRLRRFDALYVLSQSLADVVPAVVAASRRTVVQVFHLQPLPWRRPGGLLNNLLAYASERLGVALVRRFVRSVVVLTGQIEPPLRLPARTRVFRAGSGTWRFNVEAFWRDPKERSGVIYVGRLHPAKGTGDLVAAWRMVHSAAPDAVLTLVGEGDEAYVRDLRQQIADAQLGASVRLAGFVDEREKARLVGRSRAFVSASREEGWGIAVGEALTLGIPCVTYDLPVYREVFPMGRIAVRDGDAARLADALVRLLSDDARAARLAQEARTLGASFSWDAVSEGEAQAIRSVLD